MLTGHERMEKRLGEEHAIGLLKSISEADYKNTDILIFRESTGELVTERRGLKESEVTGRTTSVAYDSEEEKVGYRVMIRSPKDSDINVGGGSRAGGYEAWASRSLLTEPFAKREANHLRPGEYVKVVAINRSTGYIGTQRAKLSTEAAGNITVSVETLTMRPPNLKVWAERTYDVESGITADEERNYVIGAEGAALTSDTYVTIFTEWLDHDGSALPEGLSDDSGERYGYTGRIAKIVAENTLGATSIGSDSANFPIAPGRKTQAISVGSNLTTAEHYYIYVIGKPKDQECVSGTTCPNFDDTGASIGAEEPYANRPRYLTPFFVPLFDEASQWSNINAYRDLINAEVDPNDPNPAEPPLKPLPAYAWQLRPEYQFSQFDLQVQELNRVRNNEEGNEVSTNVLDASTPVISGTDDFVEALYSLVSNQFERLTPLDGEQELVFALGENEQRVTLGEEQSIRFDDVSQLTGLGVEDYLTMRLYTNNDAGNILWEYAFEYLMLDTQLAEYDSSTGQTLYISADNPVVPLQSLLAGYENRSNKEPVQFVWTVDGEGVLETNLDFDDESGSSFNELTMPVTAGSTGRVSVELVGSSDGKATLPPVEVVPGEPASISSEVTGKTHVDGVSNSTITVTVRDGTSAQNLVADGTGVSFFVNGSLELVSADGATTNGVATAVVTGNAFALASEVEVRVGEVSEKVAIEVHPLTVEMEFADATLAPGDTETLNIQVTDSDGQAVNDVSIELGSTYGYLSETIVNTDIAGQAQIQYTAPSGEGDGVITAQAGLLAPVEKPVTVAYPSSEDRDLATYHAALIGDKASAGSITHVRYDGVPLEMSYPVTHNINAFGAENEQVTANIGNTFSPNRAPLVAYYMNVTDGVTAPDETGHYDLYNHNTEAEFGAEIGMGNSYVFDGNQESRLFKDVLPILGRAGDFGFTIDIQPQNSHSTEAAEIVNLGQGALVLRYEDNVYSASLRTDQGTFDLVAGTAMPTTWHQVAVNYQGSTLSININGTEFTTTATGSIDYQWTNNSPSDRTQFKKNDEVVEAGFTEYEQGDVIEHDLVVGAAYSGRLNKLKWYNLNSAPLVTFADGSTQKTVSIDSSGSEELTLTSQGKMLENGSELPLQTIAVYTDKVLEYVSLISTDSYAQVAGQYALIAPDAPPIDEEALALLDLSPYDPARMKYQLAHAAQYNLFPQAHAGVLDFAWGAINWILPIESFGIVMQQLGYLAGIGSGEFDGTEFVLAFVDVLTIFPPAKALKPFVGPLQRMTRGLKEVNPRFMRYFGSALGGVMKRAKAGKFDTLWNLLPFMVLSAQMYSDDESREGLKFLMSTVDSGDDVLSWVDYLALPTNGWEDDEDPPQVDPFEGETSVAYNAPEWLFPNAYAAGGSVARRVGTKLIAKALINVSKKMSKGEAKNLADALKVIKNNIKYSPAELRKLVHSPSTMKTSGWLMMKAGARSLKNFARGRSNARYSVPMILAATAYLGWESTCGLVHDYEKGLDESGDQPDEPEDDSIGVTTEDLECGDATLFNEQTRIQIVKKFTRFLADTATGKIDEDTGDQGFDISAGGHGALFHLMQTASFQLQHRFLDGPPVKGLEKSRWVALFDDKNEIPAQGNELACGSKKDCHLRKLRFVDILLGKEGLNENETWVELKSWAAADIDKNSAGRYKTLQEKIRGSNGHFARWDFSEKNKADSLHRQFSLDRAAAHLKYSWITRRESETDKVTVRQAVGDFLWLWQAFKEYDRKKTNKKDPEYVNPLLGSNSKKHSLRWLMQARPTGKKIDNIKAKDIQRESFGNDASVSNKMQLVTASNLIKLLVQAKFSEAAEAFILEEAPDID